MDRNNSAEQTRKRLESIRDRFVARVGAKRARAIVTVSMCAIVLAACLVLCSLFFKITVIDVTGDVTMFNEGDVIRAAQIGEGDLLYLRSSAQIERKIKQNPILAHSFTFFYPKCKKVGQIACTFKYLSYLCTAFD